MTRKLPPASALPVPIAVSLPSPHASTPQSNMVMQLFPGLELAVARPVTTVEPPMAPLVIIGAITAGVAVGGGVGAEVFVGEAAMVVGVRVGELGTPVGVVVGDPALVGVLVGGTVFVGVLVLVGVAVAWPVLVAVAVGPPCVGVVVLVRVGEFVGAIVGVRVGVAVAWPPT